MTRHIHASAYQRRPVEIRLGWDSAKQYHTLCVGHAEPPEAPRLAVYSHLTDPQVTRYSDLVYYLRKLASLGLSIPKRMTREAAMDAARNTRYRTVIYESDGEILSDVPCEIATETALQVAGHSVISGATRKRKTTLHHEVRHGA
ncbi:hypothetical protein [Cupriavidus sp. CP313]